MERLQTKPKNRQDKFHKFKAIVRNIWLLLGNVLLLMGGDDSVELDFDMLFGQLSEHAPKRLATAIYEESHT